MFYDILEYIGLVEPKPTLWMRFKQLLFDGCLEYAPAPPIWWTDRTLLEQVCMSLLLLQFLICTICFMVYIRRVWNRSKLAKWIRVWLKEPTVMQRLSQYTAESVRVGSDEMVLTVPRFQCGIMIKNGDNFVVHGSAVRFPGNYLVAPDHVLSENVEKFAKGTQSSISLKGLDRVLLAADLVAIKLTANQFSKIGLAEAKVTLLPRQGVMATITSFSQRGTCARLRHNKQLFGMVTYEGTTMQGYSGCAYTDGNYCLGVHQHGGAINGGFNASYIYAMLLRMDKTKNEDSAEWLTSYAKEQGALSYKDYGLDEIMLMEETGKYHILTKDAIREVFGNDYADADGKLRLRKKGPGYNDAAPEYESLSGEARNSNLSGGSSRSDKSRNSGISPAQSVINLFKKLSKDHKLVVRKSLGIIPVHEDSTDGQTVMTGQPMM